MLQVVTPLVALEVSVGEWDDVPGCNAAAMVMAATVSTGTVLINAEMSG